MRSWHYQLNQSLLDDMAITNISKPSSPTITGITKVLNYITWNTNTTTWNTETRTWNEMQTNMTGTTKPTTTITNLAKPV